MVDADHDATEDQTLDVSIITDKTYEGTLGVADTFDFNFIADSPAGEGRATITNFESGLDVIDMSDIHAITGGADDPFTYIGTDLFSGAAGELRFETGSGMLQANVSGDLNPEMEIALTDITTAIPQTDLKL